MERDLVLKKCLKCGALVKAINDCHCDDCGIMCCGEKMVELKPNSVDAAAEKHIPEYVREDNDIVVTVNHVMDIDHYIEWICLVTENEEKYVYFKPGEDINVKFNNVSTGKLYSYCNKHSLWVKDIN